MEFIRGKRTHGKHVGERFGLLTIVRYVGPDLKNKHHHFVECTCDCGSSVVTRLGGLQAKNHTISCGCLGRAKRLAANKGNTYRRLSIGENASNHVFRKYIEHAKRRGLIFSLTKDEFRKIAAMNCYYCDTLPKYTARGGFGSYIYSGIDRVKNSLGYIPVNCVPCCRECNLKKNAVTEDMIKKIYHLYQLMEEKHEFLEIAVE